MATYRRQGLVVWSSKAESWYGATSSCDAAIGAAEALVDRLGKGELPGDPELSSADA
jgi:hypothetical protein